MESEHLETMKSKDTEKSGSEKELLTKRTHSKSKPRRRPITMEEAEEELMMEFGSMPDGMRRRSSRRTKGWYDD